MSANKGRRFFLLKKLGKTKPGSAKALRIRAELGLDTPVVVTEPETVVEAIPEVVVVPEPVPEPAPVVEVAEVVPVPAPAPRRTYRRRKTTKTEE
jgi:hypothetical protein